MRLPFDCVRTLAVGADSNSTVSFTRKRVVEISEPFKDLSLEPDFLAFRKTITGFPEPEIVACDMHPGYIASLFAEEYAHKVGAKLVRVQHHKAHIAAVGTEHSLIKYVGIACDGLGYGEDNNIWGGEVFLVKDNSFERVGHLEEQRQIGGDSAAMYPKKMLFGILSNFMDQEQLLAHYGQDEVDIHSKQLEMNYNVHLTTSTGRVLDAASALLGACIKREYEGQPAIELEKFATEPYELEPVIENNILSTTALFKFIIDNMDKDKRRLAATAQMYIAQGIHKIAAQYELPIVFTGGVAYNKMISGYMKEKSVLLNKDLAPGDANISFGQIILANSR